MDLSTRSGRREQGQRIQRAVERIGISVEELAGRIGCSRALIYQYLSGSTLAQPDRLQQIANLCGVPLASFYLEDEAAELPSASQRSETIPPAQEVSVRLADSVRLLQELADAQEGPPDYRALASTCERILSLSGQLGDRSIQVTANKRLGNALLRMADFPRAVESLKHAVTMASEAGDAESEMKARQSLGTALVSMGRHREAQEQFEIISRSNIFSGRWQGTLSLGGLHEMHGEYQQAMARFDEAATILEEGEADGSASPVEIATGLLYVNTNRRNVYMDGGDFAGARRFAEKGMMDADAVGNADQHLEARFDLAWCDFHTGHWANVWQELTGLLQLARFVGDEGRETMARAWLGILLAGAGDFDNAVGYGKDALAAALSRGDRRSELYAQLALADAYIGGLREGEARYHTNQALAVTMALRHERGEIECRLRLVRLHSLTGELTEMRDSVRRGLTLAQRLGARHLEGLMLCWQAELLFQEAKDLPETERRARLNEASESATRALRLAEETGFLEAKWRSLGNMARIEEAAVPDNLALIENWLQEAVRVLEQLRSDWKQAGAADTLLENGEVLRVYAQLARTLSRSGLEAQNTFLEQTGWPPLAVLIDEKPGEL